MEHLEGWHGGHGGAVGVGDDALGAVGQRVRVDLGDHERHLGVLPPRRGVVHDDGARRGEPGGVLLGGAAARGEDGDVDAGQVSGSDVLHLDLLAAVLQDRPGAARGGEEADGTGGEVALVEHGAHDAAHLAGGSHDGDNDAVARSDVLVDWGAHRPVPP